MTLMVISISVIFGITWVPGSILYIVEQTTSIEFSLFIFSILHTMVMFNSVVNPFKHDLVNQRFKEKIKSMLCPVFGIIIRIIIINSRNHLFWHSEHYII